MHYSLTESIKLQKSALKPVVVPEAEAVTHAVPEKPRWVLLYEDAVRRLVKRKKAEAENPGVKKSKTRRERIASITGFWQRSLHR